MDPSKQCNHTVNIRRLSRLRCALATSLLLSVSCVFSGSIRLHGQYNSSWGSSANIPGKYKTEIQDSKAVIVGSAKNIAKYIPNVMSQIHRLGKLFQDYHIIISEDGSHDNTVAELYHEDWKIFNNGNSSSTATSHYSQNSRLTVLSNPNFGKSRILCWHGMFTWKPQRNVSPISTT